MIRMHDVTCVTAHRRRQYSHDVSKADSSNRRLPLTWPSATVVESIILASSGHGNAREALLLMNSPSSPPCTTSAVLALWPLEWWTSEAIASDWDRNSKIRARQSTRNRLLYTAHAVGERASQRREQQASGRKVPAATAWAPYQHCVNTSFWSALLTPLLDCS